MADNTKKVKDKSLTETIKDKLEQVLKDMPYSSSAAKERMKKNLNPEDAPDVVPDKSSSMKINSRGNGTRPWEA